jgi:uncharacterized protein
VTVRPRRTCVACREVRDKAHLVRLTRRSDGVVVVDRAGTSPGRGAYVCRQSGCASRLVKGGRLSQAFRRPSTAAGELLGMVMAALAEHGVLAAERAASTGSVSGVVGESMNGNVEEVRGLWQPQR